MAFDPKLEPPYKDWFEELKNTGTCRISGVDICWYVSLIGTVCFLIGAAVERFIIN